MKGRTDGAKKGAREDAVATGPSERCQQFNQCIQPNSRLAQIKGETRGGLSAKNAVRATAPRSVPLGFYLFALVDVPRLLGLLCTGASRSPAVPKFPKSLSIPRVYSSVLSPLAPRGRKTLLRITYTSATKRAARRKPVALQIFELVFSFTVLPSPEIARRKTSSPSTQCRLRFVFYFINLAFNNLSILNASMLMIYTI